MNVFCVKVEFGAAFPQTYHVVAKTPKIAIDKALLAARLAAKALGRSTGAVKFKAMVEGVRFQFINQPQGVQQRLARRNRRQRRR